MIFLCLRIQNCVIYIDWASVSVLLINCCWLLINLKSWSKNANHFDQSIFTTEPVRWVDVGKDLWSRWVLSVDWKSGVMDGESVPIKMTSLRVQMKCWLWTLIRMRLTKWIGKLIAKSEVEKVMHDGSVTVQRSMMNILCLCICTKINKWN